jgi:hypothetical protein
MGIAAWEISHFIENQVEAIDQVYQTADPMSPLLFVYLGEYRDPGG